MSVKVRSGMGKDNEERKDEKKADKVLADVERSIYQRPKEFGFVMDEKGEAVIPLKEGETTSVSWTDEEKKKMFRKILTHNHPDGYGFSTGDIEFMANYGLQEIRAVGINGIIYSLRHIEYSSRNGIEFRDAYKAADEKMKLSAYRKAHREYDAGKIRDSEISDRIMQIWDKSCNRWLRNHAKEYGIEFSMRRMK